MPRATIDEMANQAKEVYHLMDLREVAAMHNAECECLVCWTLSDDWTRVPKELLGGSKRGLQVQAYGSNPNGMFVWCDECHGTIG
jgi:hypothetical protein